MSKIRKTIKKLNNTFKDKLITTVITASGIYLALVYQEAIKNIINMFFRLENTILGNVIYVLIVTIIIVFLITLISRWSEK